MNELTDIIKRHEGIRLDPYQDSLGVWTVGFGRNLQTTSISQETADQWLAEDIQSAIDDAETFRWFHSLNETRQAVIVNMIFNMGLTRFRGFKKTIQYLENGLFQTAAGEMLDSRWSDQVGDRALELSVMMSTGEWPDGV